MSEFGNSLNRVEEMLRSEKKMAVLPLKQTSLFQRY
jgi:hypothetical protein